MTRGAAPVSAGASAEFDAMITAFDADPAAWELLNTDDDNCFRTLACLRGRWRNHTCKERW